MARRCKPWVLRGGGALQPASAARWLTAGSGGPNAGAVADRPGGLQLGGWFVIDVADMERALEWAARSPSAGSGGAVDVRPLAAVPGMAR